MLEASHSGHARNSVQIVLAHDGGTITSMTIIAKPQARESETFGNFRDRCPGDADPLPLRHDALTGQTLKPQFRECRS